MATLKAAFPLGIVCFPGEIQNLHIFEPRYRDLTKDCLNDGIHFCMVPFVNKKAFHMGTEVMLDKVHTKYPDGKYDISIKGLSLVKIHKLLKKMPNKSYPGVKMTTLSWIENPERDKSKQIIEKVNILYDLLNIEKLDNDISPDHFLIHQVVHKIGLSIEQELELLSIAYESERQDYVLAHLDNFIPVVQSTQKLRMKAALNGHFKNIVPPNF